MSRDLAPAGSWTQGVAARAQVTRRPDGAVEWGSHYGCGRKVRPGELARIGEVVTREPNASLPQVEGLFLLSDAGICRLGDKLLVQTVDVILPLPFSAEVWGRAAALHCLSDLYAAGGTPTTAVGTLEVGFDSDSRAMAVSAYEAAAQELNRADVALVGGHSLMSHISKIGFTVTGVADPDEIRTVSHARPGDLVYLTKRIGVGAALAYMGATGVRPPELPTIERAMLTSNAAAADLATRMGLRCVTDVSGYGLLGALLQVAEASQVSVTVDFSRIPYFNSGFAAIGKGVASSLAEAVWVQSSDRVGGSSDPQVRLLLCDPQVSGGLVLFVPPERRDDLEALAQELQVRADLIGQAAPAGEHAVTIAEGGVL
jgi:selenide,water dikinase